MTFNLLSTTLLDRLPCRLRDSAQISWPLVQILFPNLAYEAYPEKHDQRQGTIDDCYHGYDSQSFLFSLRSRMSWCNAIVTCG